MGCATQGEKAAIIKDLREKGYQLKYLLKAMHMARSTYYFEISRNDVVAERNKEVLEEIKSIFDENKRRYGVRRVHQELINRGYRVNHKRVQRLMHESGLAGKRPKEKYHSYTGEVGKIADNIINRDFSTTSPLQKWTTDVSQFNFSWGKCYLSPVLDMNTNEIISYDLSKAVISAICGFMDLSERTVTEDAFLERVISTIREEVGKSNPLGHLLQFVQTLSAQTLAETEINAENEEAVLDFLDSF